MRLSYHFRILAAAAVSLPLAMAQAVDFEKDIQPILKDHCFKCHSGPKAKKKIRYDSARYLKELIGTHEDAIIIPGNPDGSKMLKLASLPRSDTDAMPPPTRGEPMNSVELTLVRKWIEEGARLEASPEEASPIPSAPDPNKIHSWTNTEGKSLMAAFVSAKGSSVTLRKEDGEEFDYPLNKLSPESKELASALSK